MNETVSLSKKGQNRLMVLNKVGEGRLGAGAAATLLGLSVRQVRRLLAGYRKEGAAALAHGRGAPARGPRFGPANPPSSGVA